MDLHEFLRSRHSVRRFQPDPVPEAVIERILITATYAPSAHNLQPWRFAVVTTSVAKARLGLALTTKMRLDMDAEGAPETEIEKRAANSLRRINEAPVLIVLCRDVTDVIAETPEETMMAIQSVAAAGMQLLLAAHADGLGGNWICWPLYAQDTTRAALDLPETWEPQGMVIIGLQGNTPAARQRKALEDVLVNR